MEWACSLTKTILIMYFKFFSECSFKGVITWLFDHFVTPMYKMIFEQDPPCMSKEEMEPPIWIVDWYASPSDTFIRMFSTKKPMHVLPNFALDTLFMQEVTYLILEGLKARLHQKNKAPWPALPLWIGLYEIWSIKQVDV